MFLQWVIGEFLNHLLHIAEVVAAIVGLFVAAYAIEFAVKRLNRRDDPHRAKRPPDAS
jgi:hypothetical protein